MGLRNSTCCKTKLIVKILTIKKITLEKGYSRRKIEEKVVFDEQQKGGKFEKCTIEDIFEITQQ